ncbi:MAG TPA: lipoprotein-releasing system transmembrane subunit LolC, partial [Gammaproteobacteria bacterium]|nr:lipoprotein-releasing system transmembrane subunit LolC [Gammaproteobacteria bacterium]
FGVHFLSEEVYFISRLPSQLLMKDVMLVASASLILSLLATIIPAYRAANVQPAEGLRYDH